MPYDVNALRAKLKKTIQSKHNDPNEFKPKKAESTNDPIKYIFYILPPVNVGDKTASGIAKRGMDQFYIPHATHWFNDKRCPCPRVYDGTKCAICDFGFALLKKDEIKKDDAKKQSVVSTFMPSQFNIMNIFFLNHKSNPEELRGKVMYYNAPKTVLDICCACMMREDAGDPESPEAFGVFFDENNASSFELQVLRNGKNNSYKSSKFRSKTQPMIANADGSPNLNGLTQLLAMRHNLYERIDVPDASQTVQFAKLMTEGADNAQATGGGFDSDENTPPTGAVSSGVTTYVEANLGAETQSTRHVTTNARAATPTTTAIPATPTTTAVTATPATTAIPATPATTAIPATTVIPATSDVDQAHIDSLLNQLSDDDE